VQWVTTVMHGSFSESAEFSKGAPSTIDGHFSGSKQALQLFISDDQGAVAPSLTTPIFKDRRRITCAQREPEICFSCGWLMSGMSPDAVKQKRHRDRTRYED
jgi:hypothetical protein